MPPEAARAPWILGALLASAAALGGCESAAPLQHPTTAARLSLSSPALLTAAPSASSDGSTSEVRAVFGEWVAARSRGDVATFEGLYDSKHFEGVRRAPSGLEKRLSWSEWEAEQRPLVDRGAMPAVARPVFESWQGGTLDPATASVAFEEVPNAAARGADAVQRVLVFGRGVDGKLRVLREEVDFAPAPRSGPANTIARDAKVARAMKN